MVSCEIIFATCSGDYNAIPHVKCWLSPTGDGDSRDNLVIFEAFEDYWGGAPAIKQLEIVRFDTSDEVKVRQIFI